MRRVALLALTLALVLAGLPPAAHAAEDKWNIDAEIGPAEEVAFTTDEGTWLSLDVHPDGRQLVFSLLGDLYLLPIEGGRARRITSGPAYDVQPRFSPDGKSIAFASDRAGLENVWVCDLDGGNARAISSDKKSQVNTPSWSPDGHYLLVRKRLTDRSPLGRTELWMWHVRGGEGVQLTKKDEEPEPGDATFSPDGRFIYFSARNGFRYDQDVYDGIWQVKRLDRWTGQRIPLTGEYGGGAAPMLSPDGKQMTFVRRIDARTRMEVMDLATGATDLLADRVQRDNQQGFAFHGTFPGYAWMPDGKSVVATAEGRIWRWNVETGERTAIPFEAGVQQRVTNALRFEQDLDATEVRARIVRWPVESPDGRTLVFSAMGHLYTMGLPDGRPRRLTQSDDLEYAPAFSPDGRSITYVTWNDDEGGHVWRMSASGGNARRLTRHPGQYANPSFSADGKRIVYVRGSGATFRDRDPDAELWSELHWVDASGGESHYIVGTRTGVARVSFTRPQFSRDGERVFYLENIEGKPRHSPPSVLASVQLDGTDRKEHLEFKFANEAVLSPDGAWVLFSQSENVYVTAMGPYAAEKVNIDPSSSALPIRQLSNEGGRWVGWASGGATLTWVSGPTFHRLPLNEAIPLPEPEPAVEDTTADGEDKPDLPESQRIEIDLRLPRAIPSERVAYSGARIITMNGDEVIERGVIVVDGNRITAVGPESAVEVPDDARLVDVYGKTIMPGLIDEHAHLHYSALDVHEQRPWKYLANLAYGVTTTHDPSATSEEAFEQGEMVEAGLMPGPRIYSTGSILYGAEAPWHAEIKSLDDARHHIRRMKNLGAISVKSYMHPSRKVRQWILQAAREERIMVMPEGGGDLEADMTMVLDGHTTIEHSLPIAPLYEDVIQLMASSRTAYTPTLLVAYGGHSGDKWFHQHYDIYRDEKLLRFVPPQVIVPLGRVRDLMAPDGEWHHFDVAASAGDVMRAGGLVCMGGHGQMQGLGSHWEMWAFVQGGMTPLEAIRVSTIMPAQTIGMGHALGSLEPGKLADFVVLEKNPLEKIENSDSVELVVKNGRAYTLDELER